jgi:hypothetical protein
MADTADGATTPAAGLAEHVEDATGFGTTEWRTARDLVVRPAVVLDAYLTRGPSGGGVYARPFRFYLAMCGVLMFYLFLIGGLRSWIEGTPPGLLNPAIAMSGKTREAFVNDADGWLSFAVTPVLALFYALALVAAIKGWGRTNWRLAFRSTWALLCAWTVPMLPFGPLPYVAGVGPVISVALNALLVIAFVRMGRGRWWMTRWQAVWKSLVVLVLIQIGIAVGIIPVMAIGLLGGIYGS